MTLALRFSLKIGPTLNAAFMDGNGLDEVVRILREAADKLEASRSHDASIRDINGNRVGGYRLAWVTPRKGDAS